MYCFEFISRCHEYVYVWIYKLTHLKFCSENRQKSLKLWQTVCSTRKLIHLKLHNNCLLMAVRSYGKLKTFVVLLMALIRLWKIFSNRNERELYFNLRHTWTRLRSNRIRFRTFTKGILIIMTNIITRLIFSMYIFIIQLFLTIINDWSPNSVVIRLVDDLIIHPCIIIISKMTRQKIQTAISCTALIIWR